jgi:hypothetical protein
VFSVAPQGAVFDDMLALLSTLMEEREVELIALSNQSVS